MSSLSYVHLCRFNLMTVVLSGATCVTSPKVCAVVVNAAADLADHMQKRVEFLPMESARTTKAGYRPKRSRSKSVRGPCVGAKFIQIGSFRFWKRVPCPKRRYDDDLPDGATRPFDEEEFPSEEGGPPRSEHYDPNYGYEPYWADGEWVFDKRPDNKTDANYMCGVRCSIVYQEYGEVCGRNSKFEHKTFENYCALKNEDCGGLERWMMLYRGKCYRNLKFFDRHGMKGRAKNYISSFMDTYTRHEKYVGFLTDGR